MSAYDKPVTKLAEIPELCMGLESLEGSEQQQAQSVIPGLKKYQSCQLGDQKTQKSVLGWERKGGRKEGRGKMGMVSREKCHVLKAGQQW